MADINLTGDATSLVRAMEAASRAVLRLDEATGRVESGLVSVNDQAVALVRSLARVGTTFDNAIKEASDFAREIQRVNQRIADTNTFLKAAADASVQYARRVKLIKESSERNTAAIKEEAAAIREQLALLEQKAAASALAAAEQQALPTEGLRGAALTGRTAKTARLTQEAFDDLVTAAFAWFDAQEILQREADATATAITKVEGPLASLPSFLRAGVRDAQALGPALLQGADAIEVLTEFAQRRAATGGQLLRVLREEIAAGELSTQEAIEEASAEGNLTAALQLQADARLAAQRAVTSQTDRLAAIRAEVAETDRLTAAIIRSTEAQEQFRAALASGERTRAPVSEAADRLNAVREENAALVARFRIRDALQEKQRASIADLARRLQFVRDENEILIRRVEAVHPRLRQGERASIDEIAQRLQFVRDENEVLIRRVEAIHPRLRQGERASISEIAQRLRFVRDENEVLIRRVEALHPQLRQGERASTSEIAQRLRFVRQQNDAQANQLRIILDENAALARQQQFQAALQGRQRASVAESANRLRAIRQQNIETTRQQSLENQIIAALRGQNVQEEQNAAFIAEQTRELLRQLTLRQQLAALSTGPDGPDGPDLGAEFTASIERAQERFAAFGTEARNLVRVTGISLFIGQMFRLQQALEDSVGVARDLSTAIAEVETISADASVTTEQWTQSLTGLSNAFGIDVLDQAEAAYQTLSNQVVESDRDVQAFLETANRLAVTGVTDTSSAVNLLTATLNSFNLEVEQSDIIAAQFFKTVELGRVRIEDLSDIFGRVALPANQLGVQLTELNAAIATTTIRGVQPAEALTFIRNILLKLIRPTDAMKDLFRDLGVESGEAAIATFGFGNFLSILEERTRGSTTELGELFGRIRAITGGLVFAGEGLETFNDNVKEISETTLGDFEKDFQRVIQSNGRQLDIQAQKIRNLFAVEIGQPTIQFFVDANEAIGGFDNALRKAGEAIIFVTKLLVARGGYVLALRVMNASLVRAAARLGVAQTAMVLFARASAFATTQVIALRNALLTVPGAGLAAGAAIFGTVEVINSIFAARLEAAEEANAEQAKLLEARQRVIERAAQREQTAFTRALAAQNEERRKAQATASADTNKFIDETIELFEDLDDKTKDSVKEFTAGVSARVSEIKRLFNEATQEAEGAEKLAREIFRNISTQQFRFAFDDVGLERQIELLTDRFDRAQGTAVFTPGISLEDFKRASDEANKLAQEQLKLQEELAEQQRRLDSEIFKARRALRDSFDTGNREAAQQRLRDLERERALLGSGTDRQLEIQRQINQARREFRETGSEEARRQIQDLLRQQREIEASAERQRQLELEILDAKKAQADTAIRIAEREAAAAKAEEDRLKRVNSLKLQFDILIGQVNRFNTEEVFKLEDADEIKKLVDEQIQSLANLAQAQQQIAEDTGVAAETTALIRQRALRLEEAANKRIAQLQQKNADDLATKNQEATVAQVRAFEASIRQQEKFISNARQSGIQLLELFQQARLADVDIPEQLRSFGGLQTGDVFREIGVSFDDFRRQIEELVGAIRLARTEPTAERQQAAVVAASTLRELVSQLSAAIRTRQEVAARIRVTEGGRGRVTVTSPEQQRFIDALQTFSTSLFNINQNFGQSSESILEEGLSRRALIDSLKRQLTGQEGLQSTAFEALRARVKLTETEEEAINKLEQLALERARIQAGVTKFDAQLEVTGLTDAQKNAIKAAKSEYEEAGRQIARAQADELAKLEREELQRIEAERQRLLQEQTGPLTGAELRRRSAEARAAQREAQREADRRAQDARIRAEQEAAAARAGISVGELQRRRDQVGGADVDRALQSIREQADQEAKATQEFVAGAGTFSLGAQALSFVLPQVLQGLRNILEEARPGAGDQIRSFEELLQLQRTASMTEAQRIEASKAFAEEEEKRVDGLTLETRRALGLIPTLEPEGGFPDPPSLPIPEEPTFQAQEIQESQDSLDTAIQELEGSANQLKDTIDTVRLSFGDVSGRIGIRATVPFREDPGLTPEEAGVQLGAGGGINAVIFGALTPIILDAVRQAEEERERFRAASVAGGVGGASPLVFFRDLFGVEEDPEVRGRISGQAQAVLDAEIQMEAALTQAAEALGNIPPAVESVILELREFVVLPGGPQQGFATGGPVHGPLGHDRVPAMLTAGEFVVNKLATQRFFPQLLAMNSGVRPRGFADGGPVTMNARVTVNESSSPQATAKAVVAEINRGIRQGTLRIR